MVSRSIKHFFPACGAVLLAAACLLTGCARETKNSKPPESTGQLLEYARGACAALHSYSTAYQLELQSRDTKGGLEQTQIQAYTDCDLDSGRTVQSYLSILTNGAGSQESALLSYYIPDQDDINYTRYFTHDQTNWFSQELAPDGVIGEDFSFLSQLPTDLPVTSGIVDDTQVYQIRFSGNLGELSKALFLFPTLAQEQTAAALEAELVLCLDAKTFLPYCCSLTCSDPNGLFAESLGETGSVLELFSISIFYDGYNEIPEIKVPEAAVQNAEFLGQYIEEPLPIDDGGRALLYASTAEDSPVVAIGTPASFTLDEGFSNLCNAFYNVIGDMGTVNIQFTLEQTDAHSLQTDILGELDTAMAQYAKEEAYSEILRASEPLELQVDGRSIYCDWLTYDYTYRNDSSTTGQTVLYTTEYNYWLELEDGLLLRCYGRAQILDEDLGYLTPAILAQQIFSDLTVS